MARVSWEGNIELRRINLKNQGLNSREIAEILSDEFEIDITRDMVTSRDRTSMKKEKKPREQQMPVTVTCKVVSVQGPTINPSNSNTKLFPDEAYNLKDKYVASELIKKQMKDIWELFNDNTPKKILCLSDLHAPYMNFEKIEQAINDNIDCNICVLNGDIFDGESMSSFDKMNEIDTLEELDQVIQLLDVLSVKFEHVVYVGGNHDFQRFYKYIMKNMKPGLRNYALDRLNPMKYLADKYSNVITINHNTLQIGDVVFKHPNGYSGVEMKTVVSECDILLANKFDLPEPNFRSLIIGHTHDIGSYIRNGILLMEIGCLTYTPDYRFMNPVKRRWSTGYARIELDKNNKIIFNKSRWVYLE